MMIYNRDYNVLTIEEKVKISKADNFLEKDKQKNLGTVGGRGLVQYYKMLGKAGLHYKQLFPNNYLDTHELDDKDSLKKMKLLFTTTLDKARSERPLLNFINKIGNHLIIASLLHCNLQRFSGHHCAFLFKEFELPATYKADYLLIGLNSGGYHFVFVELENPVGNITLKDGDFGKTIRKGIKQVNDWDNWIEADFSSLKLVFKKHLGEAHALPSDFLELDKSRLNYIVVAGRRKDFQVTTYKLKRKLLKESNIHLIHYDNILDNIDDLISFQNY